MSGMRNPATDNVRNRTERKDNKKDNQTVADAIRRATLYLKLVYLKDYQYGRIAKMVIGHCRDHGPVQIKERDVNVNFKDICGMVARHDPDTEDDAKDTQWNCLYTQGSVYVSDYGILYDRDWDTAWQIENVLLAFGVTCQRKVPQEKYQPTRELLECRA